MREPAFWWRAPGGAARMLAPLAAVYGAVAAQRMARPGRRVGVPVICIGNLTTGGAGKTPTALAAARFLLAAGERPYFLSRGYGGRLAGPVRVDPARHRAIDVGDEPLLLARLAATIVARDRLAGAETARAAGASIIVMDDGFQNPALAKDLALLVVDGRRGIGNGKVLPAGPLRAPLEAQLTHAHALLVIGTGAGASDVETSARDFGLPIFHGRLAPEAGVATALAGRKVLAFAGIADPDKFFATVAEAGIEVRERARFPDHHRYSGEEAEAIVTRAEQAGLLPLTTEKDLARLAGDPRAAALFARARALPVSLALADETIFRQLIVGVAARRT
jgi:tetraacyldisaccharide 4'-kinase